MNDHIPIASIKMLLAQIYDAEGGIFLVALDDDSPDNPLVAATRRVIEWVKLREATNPAQFSAEVFFTNIDEASAGIRALAAAGFAAEVSDVAEGGIFVNVTCGVEPQANEVALGQQVGDLIDKFGIIIEFGIDHDRHVHI
jgi:hypothetical protein